jgi:HAD superfamily hydrolase (TIGR01509 family)
MNKLKAIIFDVDGTLVLSEQYGHLPACNAAMKQLALPLEWSWDYFQILMRSIPGSANRLRSELEKLGYEPNSISGILEKFEPLKKKIYIDEFLPLLKIRPGIRKILKEAVEKNIRLAIVSTSYENQIRALVDVQFQEFKPYFEQILGKESGAKTSNNGFLHKQCLSLMNLNPKEVIMIEDSEEGMQAALDAGIATAVFYNDYTYGENFHHASLVAPQIKRFSISDLEEICLNNFKKYNT